MKRTNGTYFIVGLLAGALITAVLLMGGGALQGTAGLVAAPTSVYFLTDLETAHTWLAQTYPNEDQVLETAVTNLNQLLTTQSSAFGETLRSVQADIDLVLGHSYAALTGTTPPNLTRAEETLLPMPLLRVNPGDRVETCLGLDSSPYNDTGIGALYLYTQIPSPQASSMPDGWQNLDEPKTSDLFWQLLGCQPVAQGRRS